MSGPVRTEDVPPAEEHDERPGHAVVELSASHQAEVGGFPVRRALPRRTRRTVGSWCFADHLGPAAVNEDEGLDVGPHPHIGLQTVTWLVAGEVLHRDSLGSEQTIRPGQLNLMTAGRGVSHAEEHTGRYRGDLEGIQLWVAQPERTRHGPPAFEHHPELPQVDLVGGTATVLVGELADAESPARRDTDHLGVELDLRRGETVVPVRRQHEHALVVLDGAVAVDGHDVGPGALAYLGLDRDELALRCGASARVILLGGAPFEAEVVMWWNYVGRSRGEVDEAHAGWQSGDPRFGRVASSLAPIAGPRPPWR